MNRKIAPLFMFCVTFLYACGGGSGGGGNPPPPPPPPSISVAFATGGNPPTSLSIGGRTSVSASVSNDSANAGVNWSCTPSGACGSFSKSQTASGAATTYTAPNAVPSGGSVTIIAASVTDSTKSVRGTVAINSTITVQLSTPPPASLSTSGSGSSATVTATVTNDPGLAGVTWSCTPTGSCGTFTAATAPNGTAASYTTSITYTAPATVPAGGTVTITATSVADSTKNINSLPTQIIGTASVASLKGQYAFLVHSPTGGRSVATWIGSVTLDGSGNVTGGEEEIASPVYNNDVKDPILATGAASSLSGYTVDPSGHGRLTMSTNLGEVLRLSFVLTSPSHAEVIEADGSPSQGFPGSGTMDLQTPATGGFSASQISGTYSFTMVGVDVSGTSRPNLSFGGVFTADGSSNITGGSIDVNNGTIVVSDSISSGAIDAPGPDSNGRGTFHVLTPGGSASFRMLVYYIVSSKVLYLLEFDGFADMGGSAYAQGAASTSLSGNYVYQYSGWSAAGRTVGAGQLTTATGSISGGISDANSGAGTTPATGVAVSGSYATPTLTLTDAAGSSSLKVYPVDPGLNILDPNSSSGGGGALLLHTDTSINGTGILLPQQASQPFSANYAVNLINSDAATPSEIDLVGALTGGTSGLADYEEINTSGSNPMLGAALTASFTADAAHAGHSTGSITVNPASSATSPYPFIAGTTPPTAFSASIYAASNSQAFVVQTNNSANIIGRLLLQSLQ